MALHKDNSFFQSRVDSGINLFLSPTTKKRSEQIILSIAILSYVIHLSYILLININVIPSESRFLVNPISAIYTPFSFILVYEVYLLVFYLPKSTSYYIGKQYEIITLIIIRRIFKDLGELEFVKDWFHNDHDLQFTIDTATSLLLFFLIYIYYHKILRRGDQDQSQKNNLEKKSDQFILLKKIVALMLVPVLVILAIYSFSNWISIAFENGLSDATVLAYINNIFFEEFFTILIIVDVLILLASFFYSDQFHTIIRNSGFVLSTILIKVSFSVSGMLNNILIIGAVVFGLLILYIHQLFAKANTY